MKIRERQKLKVLLLEEIKRELLNNGKFVFDNLGTLSIKPCLGNRTMIKGLHRTQKRQWRIQLKPSPNLNKWLETLQK